MMNAIKNTMKELDIFITEQNIKPKDIKGELKEFFHIFSDLTDYRFKPFTTYKLENLLGICFVMAIMGKFTSFYNVEQYVKLKPTLFIRLGLVEKDKYPSNDTYSRLFSHLNNSEFSNIIISRIKRFYEKVEKYQKTSGRRMLSGDGQVVKGTGRTKKDEKSERSINILNFYDVSKGIVLCSKPVEDKTNEIPVFQSLLKTFDIKDAIITADALHCQAKTVETIIANKGDYCFAVKENQKSLFDMINKIIDKRHIDNEFGYSNRDYKIIKLKDGEITPEWKGAKSIVKTVSHKREAREGKVGEEMLFITSLTNIDEIAEAIDKRWEIENGLHRFKDIQLSQDKIRVRERCALQNMATMNNIVYSLYRIAASVLHVTPQQAKIIYEDNPMGMLKTICSLMIGNNFTMLVKKNMRGTKESKK